MNLSDLTLEKIVLELRYKRGFRFLDLCGKAVNDLLEAIPELTTHEISPNGGKLASQKLGLTINFGVRVINLTQEFVKNYQDFLNYAEKAIKILCDTFEINAFVRVGNRFIFAKAIESMSDGVAIMKEWHLCEDREKEIKKFGEGLKYESFNTSFRIENDDIGRTFRIGTLSRNMELELPFFIQSKDLTLPPPKILNIDVDFYTKKVVEKGVLNVKDFIKSNYKILEQNLFSFLERK